jgi:hypothetical protein
VLRFLFYIVVLGMAVYAVLWILDRRSGGHSVIRRTPPPRGPVGPDDDEDFLRELERRRRHEK